MHTCALRERQVRESVLHRPASHRILKEHSPTRNISWRPHLQAAATNSQARALNIAIVASSEVGQSAATPHRAHPPRQNTRPHTHRATQREEHGTRTQRAATALSSHGARSQPQTTARRHPASSQKAPRSPPRPTTLFSTCNRPTTLTDSTDLDSTYNDTQQPSVEPEHTPRTRTHARLETSPSTDVARSRDRDFTAARQEDDRGVRRRRRRTVEQTRTRQPTASATTPQPPPKTHPHQPTHHTTPTNTLPPPHTPPKPMPGAAGVEYAPMMRLLCAAACLLIALNASLPAQSRRGADARNMELVGHNDLNGGGDGGEGLALHMWPDGRRILYLAHEAPDRCLSIVDVTRPEAPALLNQLRSPAPGITRCNSLGLSGNVLAVANQAAKAGGAPAGMWVLDVSSPARVIAAKSLDDLKLSFSTHRGPLSWRAQPLVR